MKKTYISPEVLTVQVGTMHMIAESLGIYDNSEKAITNSNEIMVKKNGLTVKNVWDEEW